MTKVYRTTSDLGEQPSSLLLWNSAAVQLSDQNQQRMFAPEQTNLGPQGFTATCELKTLTHLAYNPPSTQILQTCFLTTSSFFLSHTTLISVYLEQPDPGSINTCRRTVLYFKPLEGLDSPGSQHTCKHILTRLGSVTALWDPSIVTFN